MTSNDLMYSGEFSETEAMTALAAARAAIARWTGHVRPAADLPGDLVRVSPQARWIDQAQRNLATWIAHGGFSQAEGAASPLPPLMRPVMYAPGAMTLPQTGDSAAYAGQHC